ncbi:uncharacterized protein C4orf54 homolog [Cololabis saira]|uniref:uncharacterized protein C4orf54 homolog n=1 Tax=Cololabis saira TaxID=129043 RepID=UPI002AD2E74D|nr:uncharacterized protein C4orf54 homolog [Cololabis saira]
MKSESSCVETSGAALQMTELTTQQAGEGIAGKRDEREQGGLAQGGSTGAKPERCRFGGSETPCVNEPNCDEDASVEKTGEYLIRQSEFDDYEEEEEEEEEVVSLVRSDDSGQCVTEDESHYITTHEIELSELSDLEGDCDLGAGSSTSWDLDDGYQVYSFVVYSFEENDVEGEWGVGRQPRAQGAAGPVSNVLRSDPCHATVCASVDESVSKPPQHHHHHEQHHHHHHHEHQQQQQQRGGGTSAGQIHLSITTTSRAINDTSNIQEQGNILYHARSSGDGGRYVFRGVDGKGEALRDTAQCLIAAPGRVHFGRLRGKEVQDYSSGTSSAVSELDDADKEVRNLTARAFKSLAYPYFDAINFSTSSESSASEHGIGMNRWSAFVDLKYGNVNMSHGLDQSLCQNSRASLEIAKNIENRGYKGIALASIKPPSSGIFTLKGGPHAASASTQKIQLMGKFAQSQSGVIRLTETLNFRCNVKSGMSGGERGTQFSQNAAGSRSTDEVTNKLLSGQLRGGSKSPVQTMEDVHKKAVFASSLIQNVISKKMQFEQEQKMERGEITEPYQTPSPSFTHQDSEAHTGKGGRELQARSSKFSESSSDYAIMCMDELGDFVDSGSCDTKSDSWRKDASAPATESKLEPAREAGIETKKGALEASKSTLLRSQNSAFRCWKDEEVRFQKDHKNDKTLGGKLCSAYQKPGEWDPRSEDDSKLTKMSHLFVPSIQLVSSDQEVGQQLQRRDYSQCGDEGGMKLRSNNTLYITDSRTLATSKSPEIKINLRSVRDDKTEPFGVSKLRPPNIDSKAQSLIRTDDFKCQALAAALKGESTDKVPHFMVRDIRDNKGKLQTPIHQVRDVRKLVKSSYHFVSLDNNENKSNFASVDSHIEQQKQMQNRNRNSVSPIVIKCQSVNTNNTTKQSGNLETTNQEPLDTGGLSTEGAINAPLQRAAGRAPLTSNSSSEGTIGLRIESKDTPKKQEKISDTEKKPESKMANRVAFEKLQAAVKTMEQLYVFEKNEWKRKREPQPLIGSHVLSMIANEEHGGPEEDGAKGPNMDRTDRGDSYPNMDKTPASPSLLRREDRDQVKSLQTFSSRDVRLSANISQSYYAAGSKNTASLHSNFKTSTTANTRLSNTITQTPFSNKTFVPRSPKSPLSLKISQTSGNKQLGSKDVEMFEHQFSNTSADNVDYLTIPVKSHSSTRTLPSSADKTSVYTFATQLQPSPPPAREVAGARGQEDHNQPTKRSSIVMETRPSEIPSAAIYHSLPMGMSTIQPHMYCFSPVLSPAPTIDPFQTTQRKMLLDPTTGNYFLVDTPVQPATKRLFDPETGQYVDVPMPQPPMTPVHMPISPLALSPGAYGQPYMIYPGLMAAPPVMPPRTLVPSQMAVPLEEESGEKAFAQQTEGMYMESPFYMATGRSSQGASGAQQQNNRAARGLSTVKQPVISITSQQGPRIVAPPSFDGTTMSFVVEHG